MTRRESVQRGVVVGGLVPLVVLGVGVSTGALGANPVTEVLNRLGLLALVFLVATLAVTPAQRVLGWTWAVPLRRTLGVFSFVYAALHFAFYLLVDRLGDLSSVLGDVAKRPFITVGAATLLLLLPLAATSTNGAVRRLGFRRWKLLHRLTYVCAALALVHFVWRVKADVTEPALYAAAVTVLLLARALPQRRPAAAR